MPIDRLGQLFKAIRQKKKFSRGQLARMLKVSPTVIYNIEVGRTRIEFHLFVELLKRVGFEPEEILSKHLFAIKGLSELSTEAVVKSFRNRLQLSQKRFGELLGYKSGSIIHHFEKGIRQASLKDYFMMMKVAGDNIRGLVMELTDDSTFSYQFPEGKEVYRREWIEYWEFYYVQAMRQILRTNRYKMIKRYQPGFFSDLLGISYQEEKKALDIMKRLDLIYWENAKPHINEDAKIIVPKDIPKDKLDTLKEHWGRFAREHYSKSNSEHALSSLDLLPINQELFDVIKGKIRSLQDEIHNMDLPESTDGFAYLGWQANYIPLTKMR